MFLSSQNFVPSQLTSYIFNLSTLQLYKLQNLHQTTSSDFDDFSPITTNTKQVRKTISVTERTYRNLIALSDARFRMSFDDLINTLIAKTKQGGEIKHV